MARSIKVYNHEKVNYTFCPKFRKWTFVQDQFTYVTPCGGAEIAHKIARIIAGSIKRCNGMDNLARANVARLISK